MPEGWLKAVIAVVVSVSALLTLAAASVPGDDNVGLRAGAARADITLPVEDLSGPFKRIDSRVFVRALVIESGGKRVALVVGDAPMMAPEFEASLRYKIATRLGVPISHVVLGVNHTHNNLRLDTKPGGIILPGSTKLVALYERQAMAVVDEAKASMRPARMGIGSGAIYLTGPKNSWSPKLGRVIEDVNRGERADADPRLGMVRFETLEGAPIAFVLNYAINPVLAMDMKDAISSDVPGVAARMIEVRTGDKAVALFTLGAAGNFLYRAKPDPTYGSADPSALIASLATVVAEEAIAISRETPATFKAVRIATRDHTLICPGKSTTPFNLPDRCAHEEGSSLPACKFVDSERDPVSLSTGVVQIGPLALVHANSNVSLPVGARLGRESPLANTWIASLNFGPMRYVVADADYPLNTYEATATTAKQGCAESGFVKSSLDMIAETSGLATR